MHNINGLACFRPGQTLLRSKVVCGSVSQSNLVTITWRDMIMTILNLMVYSEASLLWTSLGQYTENVLTS